MIISVHKLKDFCCICGKRADFEVRLSNEDLPENFVRAGERAEPYCLKHLPQEAKDLWNYAIPDIKSQQIT